jgi:LCP family protein required for cell wall assembly
LKREKYDKSFSRSNQSTPVYADEAGFADDFGNMEEMAAPPSPSPSESVRVERQKRQATPPSFDGGRIADPPAAESQKKRRRYANGDTPTFSASAERQQRPQEQSARGEEMPPPPVRPKKKRTTESAALAAEEFSAADFPAEQGKSKRSEKSSSDVYYVPSIEIEDDKRRRRYKTRNKKPWKMWQKATLTGSLIGMTFISLLVFASWQLVMFQMNANSLVAEFEGSGNVDDLTIAPLSKAEEDSLTAIEEAVFQPPDTPVMSDKEIMNILFIGSDTRTGSATATARADAIMIISIDKKHQKIKLLSVVRDLYVSIPGYKGSKINSAFKYGGVELLKKTLSQNLSISVDKHVIVDFKAFKAIINKLGTVSITLSEAEAKYLRNNKIKKFPRFTKEGTYEMNGDEALMFSRIRKIDSDFGRTNRQKEVVDAIVKVVKKAEYSDLALAMYDTFQYVSTDFSQAELLGLITDAPTLVNYEIKDLTLPVYGTHKEAMIGGVSTIIADLNLNAKLVQNFIYKDEMKYADGAKATGANIPDPGGINWVASTTTTTTTKNSDTEDTEPATTKKAEATTTTKKTEATTAAPTTAAPAPTEANPAE